MYKLYKNSYGQDNIARTNEDGSVTSFGQHPDNTDYQNFKTQVLAGAELQDDTGNVMTDASAFIGTLP